MNNQRFFEDLERNFAEEDNARFDSARRAQRARRRNVRDTILAGAVIVTLTFLTFYVLGVFIFSHMPEPV